MCKSAFILFTLLHICSWVFSQDKIYYKRNKIDNWKITEVNPQYLKAVDAADPELAYSTTPANVLFVFNKSGNFLVVPGMYDGKKNAEANIKNFFNEERSLFHGYDKLITTKNEIIICTYRSIDEDKIIYTVNKKDFSIAKSEIAVIIFKSGEHQLFTSADKAVKVLDIIQEKYTELAAGKYDKKPSGNDTSVAEAAGQEDTLVNNKTPQVLVADTIKNGKGSDQKLPASTLLKLQNKALANIKQLGDYFQLICQKDSDPDEVTKTIEQALALFIGDAKIEVSSLYRSTVNQFAIKDYLIRLGLMKYEKVIIEWYNIQYTSVLRKGPDGFYYGTIEFEQRFVGISADNRTYEDITRKTVEVVLKTYERNSGGETTLEWDVFLGDIGVTVTKPA